MRGIFDSDPDPDPEGDSGDISGLQPFSLFLYRGPWALPMAKICRAYSPFGDL